MVIADFGLNCRLRSNNQCNVLLIWHSMSTTHRTTPKSSNTILLTVFFVFVLMTLDLIDERYSRPLVLLYEYVYCIIYQNALHVCQ